MGTLLVMKAAPSAPVSESKKEPQPVLAKRLARLARWIKLRRKIAAVTLVFWAIYGFVCVIWLTR